MNKSWKIYQHNFDDISSSLTTLSIVITLDNWKEILEVAINSNLPIFVT